MWWRRFAEVQTEHQNGEERDLSNFEPGMVVGCCQTGLSEYFKNCWSTGIFTHNHLYGLQRMVRKIKNVQWAAVVLNLCHEELRQFWRQKGVQPGTSKVYLIKWPVSVYIWVCNLHFRAKHSIYHKLCFAHI